MNTVVTLILRFVLYFSELVVLKKKNTSKLSKLLQIILEVGEGDPKSQKRTRSLSPGLQ